MGEATIEDYFHEDRTFPPSPEFVARSVLSDDSLATAAAEDRVEFWATQARELLSWYQDFSTVLEWDLPNARWFADGTLNVSYNCIDRHVEAGLGDRVAFHWEGEPGDTRTITYLDLLDQVGRLANALKGLGIGKGDRVAIYLPMIPEAVVAMLACARIGAIHTVIFGGFSPDSIADRVNDTQARLVITADGGFRRGSAAALKPNVDEAIKTTPSVEQVVVVRRTGQDIDWDDERDWWYHELVDQADAVCPPEHMGAEDLLFLLYTSGTTAKPKGIMHSTGGYLTQSAFTHKYVFDLQPETDVYWCTADIGWVTGHSYIVYGPLANGATSVLYEGTPDTPGRDRIWDIVERYGVTQIYTAPTAIRMFMKWGHQEPAKHDLSSLRLLGSVGEPINPEAWMWYQKYIGGGTCPIVDTWWQTETGAIMISPLPGVTTTKPGSATMPLPGISAGLVDDHGESIDHGGGYLTLNEPWPSMLRGIWGDPARYQATYWSEYEGLYFAGDGCKIDADGYYWLLGRVDDVMNVSGHRVSTTEVESALVDHQAVAEAAVVGAADATTGQAIIGYVILKGRFDSSSELVEEIRQHVATKIGPTARPKTVVVVPDLPKTRSGKIMRRLLRDVAEGRQLGDTTTLADESVVEEIRARAAEDSSE